MTRVDRSSALVTDVIGRFAGGTQQAGRLLAERVEQLLLVEWPGRVQLLLEIVERGNKLFLAFAGRCELLGDTAEERAHLGGGVAAECPSRTHDWRRRRPRAGACC